MTRPAAYGTFSALLMNGSGTEKFAKFAKHFEIQHFEKDPDVLHDKIRKLPRNMRMFRLMT